MAMMMAGDDDDNEVDGDSVTGDDDGDGATGDDINEEDDANDDDNGDGCRRPILDGMLQFRRGLQLQLFWIFPTRNGSL